jgi:hypothetical protein
MLNERIARAIVTSLWLLATAACGGADTSEAKTPAQADKASSKEVDTAGDGGSQTGDSAEDRPAKPGDAANKQDKPAETGPTLTRSPKDIITAPDLLFVFSFASSEIGEKTEERCAKQAKDNPKKQNQCTAKERKKITQDVVGFSQDKKGKWWWLTARMKGSRLVPLHKVAFEFGEEKADSIVIKPKGRDKGTKPWANVPKSVTIGVPNEFSIVLTDPKYGKMVYEAKIGIAGGG